MNIDTHGLYERIVTSGVGSSRLVLKFTKGGYEIVTDNEKPLRLALRKVFHGVSNVKLTFLDDRFNHER